MTRDPTPGAGDAMHRVLRELYPICRSITGDGVRSSLRILSDVAPVTIREVPSGTPVFDWEVPREWNVRDAFVAGPDGRRLIDFRKHNLHLMGYSVPVDEQVDRATLDAHLHSLPEHPQWIPYRTSYYRDDWGFCLADADRGGLGQGPFHVRIDSTLAPGALTYGELEVGPPDAHSDVLLFAHCCHPSLANDNLSGMVVLVHLAAWLADRDLRHRYRIVFAPGTIGSLTWLSQNQERLGRIRGGLVVTLVGDGGPFTYKRSRRQDAPTDRALEMLLRGEAGARVVDFSPYGYDERQFCSPGIDLPIGRLTRTPNGAFPEYHTSADDPSFVSPSALAGALALLKRYVDVVEGNATYRNTSPMGEPQLGRRGLYGNRGGGRDIPAYQHALLWVLNQSDGTHDLVSIACRAELPFELIRRAATDLVEAGLLANDGQRVRRAGVGSAGENGGAL